jgi:hypothetical protein
LHGEYLRVVHSYHFMSNRAGDVPGVRFEVRLKDANGKALETVKFPEASANPWVRHREQLLAAGLAPDMPVEMPQGEVLPAPGAKSPTVSMWAIPGDTFGGPGGETKIEQPANGKIQLHLRKVPQHLVPRNRPVMQPSDWGILLARSYARYLCRSHGAATAEVVRYSRDSIPPEAMTTAQSAGQAFEDLPAYFGEVSQ